VITPVVTEITRPLESVTRDAFADNSYGAHLADNRASGRFGRSAQRASYAGRAAARLDAAERYVVPTNPDRAAP
jgi:hypothetical protein